MLKKKKINKCEVKIKHMSIIICPKVSKVLNTPPQVSPSLMSSPLSNKVFPPLPPPRGIDEQINITCTNMDVNFKKLQSIIMQWKWTQHLQRKKMTTRLFRYLIVWLFQLSGWWSSRAKEKPWKYTFKVSYHIIIMGNLGRSVTNTLAMVMSLVLVNCGVMYMKTYNEKLYNHIWCCKIKHSCTSKPPMSSWNSTEIAP